MSFPYCRCFTQPAILSLAITVVISRVVYDEHHIPPSLSSALPLSKWYPEPWILSDTCKWLNILYDPHHFSYLRVIDSYSVLILLLLSTLSIQYQLNACQSILEVHPSLLLFLILLCQNWQFKNDTVMCCTDCKVTFLRQISSVWKVTKHCASGQFCGTLLKFSFSIFFYFRFLLQLILEAD